MPPQEKLGEAARLKVEESYGKLPKSFIRNDGQLNKCISEIFDWINAGRKEQYFVCANPHSLEVARGGPHFDLAIRNADLVVPDGIGVVIASRILGGSLRERITGSDIFLGLSNVLNKERNADPL